MKLTVLLAGASLVLATSPALAQLAGSGNLVNTQATQPNWPGVNHQSTTMVAGGGGTRGVVYNVNGGDLAPGVQKNNIIADPDAVSGHTKARSAGAWAEVGPQSGGLSKGATVRVDAASSLGAGPSNVYRSVDLNTPSRASGLVAQTPGGGNPSTGNLGGGNLAGNSLVSNAAGKLN